MALEFDNGWKLEEFQGAWQTSQIAYSRLFVDILALMTLLVKTHKEVRSVEEKTNILLNHHKQTAGRSIDIKGTPGESSEGNGKFIIRHWKKGDPCYSGRKISWTVSYSEMEQPKSSGYTTLEYQMPFRASFICNTRLY